MFVTFLFIFGMICNGNEWNFLNSDPNITLHDYISMEPQDGYQVVYDLMKRVLGSDDLIDQFKLEFITPKIPVKNKPNIVNNGGFWNKKSNNFLDEIELDNDGTNIIIRGTSIIALTKGFGLYLEKYLNTTYDWELYSIQIPSVLPLPMSTKIVRSVPLMYYQNVCTVSYTFAFWDWNEWEKHLDWMAMQGINLPLAFTGQEYIWSKAFNKFGFNEADLQAFFSGPGFFAWQRMGNLRGWGGPIREETIVDQYNMQLKILARMNSFGMKPALTCFAGHVPYAITTYYPNASVIPSPNWWGSVSEYCCDLLLNFSDPLFVEIGTEFIKQQTKYFGTGNVYQCDTFNEMDPPTTDANYLKSVSGTMYEAMNNIDPDAIWLIQGWCFVYNPPWNTTNTYNYLSGVPKDGLIVLDLYSEVDPRYPYFNSFFGYPWIWNTLHNFGGNHGLTGTLYNISNGIPTALSYPDTSVIGVGTTMEGIWQNYIVYDLTYQMGYNSEPINVDDYVNQYAMRRYGLSQTTSNNTVVQLLLDGWNNLKNTVYNISHWGGVQKNMMCCTPTLTLNTNGGFQPTKMLYNPNVVQYTWKRFINVGDQLKDVEKFNYDLIDITRQVLSDEFNVNYQSLVSSYTHMKANDVKKYGDILLTLMDELDSLLATNYYWLLGPWIELARNQSSNETNKDYWEFNAKNQISLWGPNGEINNYASKNWQGLIGDYHKSIWTSFIDTLYDNATNHAAFNQQQWNAYVLKNIEQPWQNTKGNYTSKPYGNTIEIACQLYIKYNIFGDNSCL